MSTLQFHEKSILERLFDRDGYVLNFTNQTFAEFFREHGINIDLAKYHEVNGSSKMKRLRAFWELEPDVVVGKVLVALIQYATAVNQITDADARKANDITARLLGRPMAKEAQTTSPNDFLKEEFANLNLARLSIDGQLMSVIEQRIDEIQKSLKAKIPLATIFLCGSTLEGLLLDSATKNVQKFNSSKSSPRDKDDKVRQLHEWSLESLINVAHEASFLSLDVKNFSHALKGFRNYIHPRQQALQGFKPDEHTALISWQVLQAAIADLSGQRKKLD
jgi:hypothetical protein